MAFRVGEEYRTNRISTVKSNSWSVFVRQPNNSVREYTNVRWPKAFMDKIKKSKCNGTEVWSKKTV